MRLLSLVAGVSMLGFAACGGGGGSTSPAPPPSGGTQTLSTIRFASNSIALTAGTATTLPVVEALDATGRVITGAAGYTYSSSATAVAESQGDGAVLAIGAGSATITASLTRDGVTATATITVNVSGSLPGSASVAAGNSDLAFTPPTVVVARNASVTFSFGALNHSVNFRATAGAPANVPVTTNGAVARSFPSAGDFNYDCGVHAGMSGKVVVR